MNITVTERRQKTMLERIGSEAAELIENNQYLPFYRSIQIKLEKMGRANEWQRMIDTAKTKANPKHYFATLCKMAKDGTYRFVEKVKEVAKHTASDECANEGTHGRNIGCGNAPTILTNAVCLVLYVF